ncbi:MAG: hypothetical protein HKN68_21870 [Saprospiraceae bacterium]|nr:hypothetical protein [Saprospiraceae bacterium]
MRFILLFILTMSCFPMLPGAQPTIVGPGMICEGSSAQLSVQENYTSYMWSTGEMTQSITVSTSGTYSVTVTGGLFSSKVLQVNPLPDVQISTTSNLCIGFTTNLDAGPGFESYLWNTGANTQEITIASGGEYSVTVSDNNGCEGADTINISAFPNPEPTITGANQICVGGTAIINAGAWQSYSWNNGRDTRELVISSAGTYTVTVTDTNGCKGEDTFSVGLFPQPSVEIMGTIEICDGESTELSVDPGYSLIMWSTEETTPSITINSTGEYSVSITDDNGCMAEDAISINNPIPVVICPPDTFITISEASLDTIVNYGVSVDLSCGNSYPITQTDASGLASGDPFPIGSTQQSFRIEAVNGIQSTCDFTVNVVQQSDNVIKLENGDLFLKGIYNGAIYQSPDGSCWKIMVSNSGEIKAFKIKCP